MTKPGFRFPQIFSGSLLFLLLLAMIIGFFNPIYSDEISYRLLHARLFLDHGKSFVILPQCFPADWEASVSSFSVPYNALESLYYNFFSTPLIVRVTSLLKGIFLVFLFYRLLSLIQELGDPRERRKDIAVSFTFAVFSLGVSPFLFVINRPEQELLFAIFGVSFLILKSAGQLRNRSIARDLTYLGGFFVMLLLAFGAHPNTLYFLPFLFFAAFKVSVRPLFRGLSMLFLAILAVDTVMYMALINSCPRDPLMQVRLNFLALQPYFFYIHPAQAIQAMLENVFLARSYFHNLAFSGSYPYFWIPSHPISVFHTIISLAIFSILAVVGLAVIGGFFLLVKDGFQKKRPRLLSQLGIVLLLSLFILIAIQVKKNWYGSILVVPLTGLIGALFWNRLSRIVGALWLGRWLVYVKVMCLASLLLFFWSFGAIPFSSLVEPGASKKEGISFSGFGYAGEAEKIWETAGLCGFKKGERYRRIALDNLTYWALREVQDPIDIYYVSRTYVKDPSYFQTIGSLENFLKERGAAGIVARCDEVIEPELLKQGKKLGQYCCWDFRKNQAN